MVTAREIDRGKISEAFVTHTKEFRTILYIKRNYCKFLSQGMAEIDKEFKKIMLKVWRKGQREGKLEADKEDVVAG